MDEKNGVTLTVDFDKGSVGFGADDVVQVVTSVIAELSPNARSALGWLPDTGTTRVELEINLKTGAVAGQIVQSDAQGEALATAYIVFGPGAGIDQGAVSIGLDADIDLGATPLFGALLSGVRITDLAASYAAADMAGGAVILPDGSAAPPRDLARGFGLTLSLVSGGSTETLQLSSVPADGTDAGMAVDIRHPARTVATDFRRRTGPSLHSAVTTTPDPVLWFPVQKSIGPLSIDRIGVVLGTSQVGLALDAALHTEVVSITLTGFVLELSKSPASVSVRLDGLAVNVSSGTLQIAGALVRTAVPGGVEYDGSVLIRVAQYTINAAGSYGVIAGVPSLFVFGLMLGELGGPPMFFVTGLAAGFGVNRALRLPKPDQVRDFPLIRAATQGSGYLPAQGVQGTQDALATLASGGWVPPTPGEYWVAAGVAFRSFELINGFALLTVQFGRELSVALLGIAALKLPSHVDGGPAFAYVEITLEAVLVPAAGTFSLSVLLSPNSYVIAPECHLTGGLAVDIWFGANPHAGDFVVSLGGYHPLFLRPAWYPAVPRLGFQWKLTDALRITGESYFAITPSCAMGGGRLAVTFDVGALHAWLTAQVDFIMYWRPFWFEVDVQVSIGISYTVSLAFFSTTFSVDLGVSVVLWGPPMRGIAHVNWFVISFDIPINGGGSPTPTAHTLADWSTFAATSLPTAGTTPTAASLFAAPLPAAVAAAGAPVCKARAATGLRGMADLPGGQTLWLFDGDGVSLVSESAIPADSVVVVGPSASTGQSMAGHAVHAYPLGNVPVSSTHTVAVTRWTGAGWHPGQPLPAATDVSEWSWSPVQTNLPGALWGARGNEGGAALGSSVVAGVTGVVGIAPAPTTPGQLTVPTATLMTDELPGRSLVLGVVPAGVTGPVTTGDLRSRIASSIVDPTTTAYRSAVVSAVSASGMATGLVSGSLTVFSSAINAVLDGSPAIGVLGTTGPAPSRSLRVASSTRGPMPERRGTDAPATSTASIRQRTTRPPDQPLSGLPVLRVLARQDQPVRASDGGFTRLPAMRATVLDRHTAAGDRSRFAALGPHGEQPAPTTMLWPGWTGVWNVAGSDRTLTTTGGRDSLLVTLDPDERVMEFVRLQAPLVGRELPSRARVLALGHLALPGPAVAAGWASTSVVTRVSSQTFVGDGIVIRTQSPTGGGRASDRARGVVTASRPVRDNWTLGGTGGPRRGWIETWLPTPCVVVAVTVIERTGDAAVVVPAVSIRRPAPIGLRPLGSSHIGTWDGGREAVWVYEVPDPAEPGPVVVRVEVPGDCRLGGVVGFPRAADYTEVGHPSRHLASAVPPDDGSPMEVRWT